MSSWCIDVMHCLHTIKLNMVLEIPFVKMSAGCCLVVTKGVAIYLTSIFFLLLSVYRLEHIWFNHVELGFEQC